MKSRIAFKSYSKRPKRVVYPTVALATINFIAFCIGSSYLGCDAINVTCAPGTILCVSTDTARESPMMPGAAAIGMRGLPWPGFSCVC